MSIGIPPAGPHQLGPEAHVALLENTICVAVVTSCQNAFESRLRGIVLTGSMARHEATFVWNFNHWKVLGDAEFFLIFDDGGSLPPVALVEAIREEAKHRSLEHGMDCRIDLSPVHTKYLTGLQPHILAYELRHCGQVVWGDPGLLALITPFSASEILLEDAWRLLSNRMIEYLDTAAELSQASPSHESDVFYRTVKLYLDMATSFLLFAGRYQPTYGARAEQLRYLAIEMPSANAAPFPLADLADRVDFCTRFKLQEPGYSDIQSSGLAGKEAISFVTDALGYAHRLWHWELCQLTGLGETVSDSELMSEWMRRQPKLLRFRGWARVVRDAGWLRSWREWPRWATLALRASPRHWVYAAGAEIFFRQPVLTALRISAEPDRFDVASVCRWLPFPPTESDPVWTRAAAAVCSNYKRFVAVTRT